MSKRTTFVKEAESIGTLTWPIDEALPAPKEAQQIAQKDGTAENQEFSRSLLIINLIFVVALFVGPVSMRGIAVGLAIAVLTNAIFLLWGKVILKIKNYRYFLWPLIIMGLVLPYVLIPSFLRFVIGPNFPKSTLGMLAVAAQVLCSTHYANLLINRYLGDWLAKVAGLPEEREATNSL